MQRPSQTPPEPRTVAIVVFGVTVGAGALLLFVLEPLVGKLVLPVLGGAPAVWNTCLMFFQAMLLAGYAWVHFGTRLLGVSRHALLHGLVVVLAVAALPSRLTGGWPADAAAMPVRSLLAMLTVAVGAPFFVLATTAPLVQRWLSRTRYPGARDPYHLYAASNAGSLVGLLAYPFLIEPLMGLETQRSVWSLAWIGYTSLLGLTALFAWRGKGSDSRVEGHGTDASPVGSSPDVRAEAALKTTPVAWVFRAFVPSALLLTVTAWVTTDLAPVPLLWIVPLALYLGSFIIAFARPSSRLINWAAVLLVPLCALIGMLLVAGHHPVATLPAHLLFLAVTAYVAHGELARGRPAPEHLTAYYLWISLGGALGGVLIALITPLLMRASTEYLLLVLLALLVRRSSARPGRAHRRRDAASARGAPGRYRPAALMATFGVSLLVFRLFLPAGNPTLVEERNFFGTTAVLRSDDMFVLRHGRTVHGFALIDPERRSEPTAYYGRPGPLGDAMRAIRRRRVETDNERAGLRAGVAGLGAGTVACYAEPGDAWTFLEINPAMIRLASDTTYFRFLSDCSPDATIVRGDARLRLARAADGTFDIIILDAFGSDAIPVHLMTREAFELYRSKLAAGGTLLIHITNNWLDLEPVIADHAVRLGFTSLIRRDNVTPAPERVPSDWVVLTRDETLSDALRAGVGWVPLRARQGFRPWTDDYSNILSVLRPLRAR